MNNENQKEIEDLEQRVSDLENQRVSYLEEGLLKIIGYYNRSQTLAISDANDAIANCRRAAERVCKIVIREHSLDDHTKAQASQKEVNQANKSLMLEDMLSVIYKEIQAGNHHVMPRETWQSLKTIQGFGNIGVHDGESDLKDGHSNSVILDLSNVILWLTESFSNHVRPEIQEQLRRANLNHENSNKAFKQSVKDLLYDGNLTSKEQELLESKFNATGQNEKDAFLTIEEVIRSRNTLPIMDQPTAESSAWIKSLYNYLSSKKLLEEKLVSFHRDNKPDRTDSDINKTSTSDHSPESKVVKKKNAFLAIVLSFLLGPFGLFYVSAKNAIIFISIFFVSGIIGSQSDPEGTVSSICAALIIIIYFFGPFRAYKLAIQSRYILTEK